MNQISRLFPFIFLLLLLSKISIAQIKIGPEIGANFAMQKASYGATSESIYTRSSTLKVGALAGVNVDIKVLRNFYVQTGVLYTYDNIKFKDAVDSLKQFGNPKMETKDGIHYLRVPLYFMYKSGYDGSGRFIAGVGPYLAYAFLANRVTTQPIATTDALQVVDGYYTLKSSEQLQLGDNKSMDQLRHWDYGLNACIGYESNVGMFFRGYFNWGLQNLYPQGNDQMKLQNWGMGVTVGFNIGRDDW